MIVKNKTMWNRTRRGGVGRAETIFNPRGDANLKQNPVAHPHRTI